MQPLIQNLVQPLIQHLVQPLALILFIACMAAIASSAQVPVLRTALVVEGRADSAFGFSVERLIASNTVVVRGAFTGSLSVEGSRYASRGLSDGFLCGVNDDLRMQWLQTFGGPGYDAITFMAPLPDGGLAVGMICGAGADGITTYRIGDITFTGRGGADAVVFVLNNDGSVRWVRNDGAINAEYPTSLAIVNDSLIVVAGIFLRQSRFGSTDVSDSAEISGYVQAISMSGNHRWVRVVRGKGVNGSSAAVEIDALYVHTTASGRIDVAVQTTESMSWGSSTLVVNPDAQQRTTAIVHADVAGNELGIDTVETCVAEQTTFGSSAGTISAAVGESVNDACTAFPFDAIAWRADALLSEAQRSAVAAPQFHHTRDGVRGPIVSGCTGAQPLLLSLDARGIEQWRYVFTPFVDGSMYDAVQTDTSIIAVAFSRVDQDVPWSEKVHASTVVLLRLDVPSGVHDKELGGFESNATSHRDAKVIYYDQLADLFGKGYALTTVTGSTIVESGVSSPLHRPLAPQVCVLSHPTEPSRIILLLP